MVRWLNTRWGLRFLSVVVATLLWLVVYLDESSVLDVAVPVEVVNVPPGLALRTAPVRRLSLRLSGPRLRLLFLDRRLEPLRLDLDGAGEGDTVFANLGMQLKLPDEVRVNRIAPASVKITLVRSPRDGRTNLLTEEH